jgi:hypothetical protein
MDVVFRSSLAVEYALRHVVCNRCFSYSLYLLTNAHAIVRVVSTFGSLRETAERPLPNVILRNNWVGKEIIQ